VASHTARNICGALDQSVGDINAALVVMFAESKRRQAAALQSASREIFATRYLSKF
jgi:hypothetical protein